MVPNVIFQYGGIACYILLNFWPPRAINWEALCLFSISQIKIVVGPGGDKKQQGAAIDETDLFFRGNECAP